MEALIEVPPDRLLFSDYLYDKQKGKLKKLKVQLRRLSTSDGSKAFNLDISGVRPVTRLQLDFTEQDICFLRLEELQDHVREKLSCFACLSRNYYPHLVHTRLMLLLYSIPDNGDEAKCIKIPLLQPGNIHAATTLHRLRECIYSNIVKPEEIKHWPVTVMHCGDMYMDEPVFLCLTKYAILIIKQHVIFQYHTFYSSHVVMNRTGDEDTFEIIVQDKTWLDANASHSNFSLSRKYVFKTSSWKNIEQSFKELMRKSQLSPQRPLAHFNIRHSELSASFVPGTTSDNVTIIPHTFGTCENNNTGSSSGNGHILSSKIENVEIHFPEPHIPGHFTTSSNGSIPNSGSSFLLRGTVLTPPVRQELDSKRRKSKDVGKVNREIPVPNNLSLDPSATTPLQGAVSIDSDPGRGRDYLSLKRHQKSPSFDASRVSAGFDNSVFHISLEETIPKFVTDDELDLPLPPPCSATSQPHAGFDYLLPPPAKCSNGSSNDSSIDLPERQHSQRILRSHSFMEVNKEDEDSHYYANFSQELSFWGSVHDDSIYYRFYYNVGFMMVARMSKKLKRRDRLSKEIKQVDFNKLENHEHWYDRDYKVREKDLKFCKLMNIRPDKVEYNYHLLKPDQNDDPYWTQSDLCVTLQLILQELPKEMKIFDDIRNTFDLTSEQLMHVNVLLSLTPSDNNWRMLAEYIGLTSSDISIIEHFCYTYRELAAKVVLAHWMIQCRQGKMESLECSLENLTSFLHQYDRDDVLTVVQIGNVNPQRQTPSEIIEMTHF